MPLSIDRRRALALLGSFVAAPRLGRAAEAWPIRSVKYVNGFPAGGATDEFGCEIFTVPFASVLGKLH